MPNRVIDPETLVYEILVSDEGRRDPYSRYAALHKVAPIHRSALGDLLYLTRYDDCRFVLRDPRFGKHPEVWPDVSRRGLADATNAVTIAVKPPANATAAPAGFRPFDGTPECAGRRRARAAARRC